jgi:hypothetical protein
MAEYKPIKGSYWEHYPVPENAQRCFMPRRATGWLSVPRRSRGQPWLYRLGYLLGGVLLMAAWAAHQ